MAIQITTQAIHAACAGLIRSVDPQGHIYDNPTQQKAVFPAWWILHRENNMEHEACNRLWLTHGIELVYVLAKDNNDTRLYDKYFAMADKLAEKCDIITFTEGDEHQNIHTIQQNWNIERDALHFSFQLRIRVSASKEPVSKMMSENTNVHIKGD